MKEELSFAGIEGLVGCVGMPLDTPRLLMPVVDREKSLLMDGGCAGNGGRLFTEVAGSLKLGGGNGGGMLVLRPFAFAGWVFSSQPRVCRTELDVEAAGAWALVVVAKPDGGAFGLSDGAFCTPDEKPEPDGARTSVPWLLAGTDLNGVLGHCDWTVFAGPLGWPAATVVGVAGRPAVSAEPFTALLVVAFGEVFHAWAEEAVLAGGVEPVAAAVGVVALRPQLSQ